MAECFRGSAFVLQCATRSCNDQALENGVSVCANLHSCAGMCVFLYVCVCVLMYTCMYIRVYVLMHVCRMCDSMHANEDTDVITRRWLMQCGAVCCSAVQCDAVRLRCSALQCCSSDDDKAQSGMISRTIPSTVAVHCSALRYSAL